jgi:cob(I)alamin adenosyltransferase
MFEDYETKESVVVVYTGDGKGKTSASLGLMLRALGADMSVAYVQFIKHWEVSEHKAIFELEKIYPNNLTFVKGGKGFFNAGDLSAKDVSEDEHKKAAQDTYSEALDFATSGDYDLVICDEINNAVNDGLISKNELEKLIKLRAKKTSICLTGRNFPTDLLSEVDIASEMTKLKHHFDDKFLANKGIDY